MKQRYNKLTEDLCCLAVRNCFRKKWRRRDFIRVVEEYAGVSKRDIFRELDAGGNTLKEYSIKCIGYEVYNRLNRLLQGKRNALELDPVQFKPKIDGMNGKLRNIAHCCVFHQIFNHLLVIGLYPLFKAKLLPFQFASIPGKGQTGLKDFVMKKLRKKSFDIRHARKTDVIHAYENTKYETVIETIAQEIPSAKWIISLLRGVAEMSPAGCLIIGGYVDAWLFNFLMSYALRFAKEQRKTRRDKQTPLIKTIVSFMDDFGFMGSRDADIKRDIKLVNEFLFKQARLRLKFGKHTEFISIADEKRRRKADSPAKRKCPFLDIAGYQMTYGHVTIRKVIFLRVRRTFLRAAEELKATGKIHVRRAYSIISHFGYLKSTNSKKARQKYDADHLHTVARYTVSQYQKLKNRRI